MCSLIKPLKILLIEDNSDFSFLFGSLLKSMGHSCVSACNGAQGIMQAKKNKTRYCFLRYRAAWAGWI